MRQKLIIFIATVGYIGYFPIGQGTLTSLFAAAICRLAWKNHNLYFGILLVSYILGFFCCGQAEDIFKKKDSPRIVIDEFCGMFITFMLIKINWPILIVGFLLFRIFDITKPLFIRELQGLKGSWGIMLDDVFAGLAANIVLQLGIFAFRIF